MTYIDSEGIFGICRVNLHNRILISTYLDDLHFSASITVRPKLWRLGGAPGKVRGGSNLATESPGDPYSLC